MHPDWVLPSATAPSTEPDYNPTWHLPFCPDTIEMLEREITTLGAHISAATCRLIQAIGEFDRLGGWQGAEICSCAHWLSWRCGISLNVAYEKVRVANALVHLPQITAAFERGEVSYSKVRAMTRVATSRNEDYLLMIARHGTASHMERLVRAYRGVVSRMRPDAAKDRHRRRKLRYWHEEDGTVVLQAHLEPEVAARVLAALDAGVETLKAEAQAVAEPVDNFSAEDLPTLSMQRADALELMAETLLEKGADMQTAPERHQLVVHVAVETLVDPAEPGRCEVEDGPWLSAETARRIGCDTTIVSVVEDADGTPLDVGRRTRSIPSALRRALHERDGGCRFPGCTRRHHVEAHHIEHWANGGSTSLENLVNLCYQHHRLIHEGGYQVEQADDGGFRFIRPDGKALVQVPPLPESNPLVLSRLNHALGIKINRRTGRCLWDGVQMDYGMAIDGLIWRDWPDAYGRCVGHLAVLSPPG